MTHHETRLSARRTEWGFHIVVGRFEVKGRKLVKGARLRNGFPHVGRYNIAMGIAAIAGEGRDA